VEQTRPGPWDFLSDPNRRTTNALMALNIGCYLLQVATRGRLINWGAKVNSAIAKGETWRLLTATALHVNVLHLLVNLYSLHNVGPALERVSGKPRMLASYVAGGFVGNVASFYMCPSPAVGASGAIIGLVGGLFVYYSRHKDLLGRRGHVMTEQIKKMLVLNLLLGLLMPQAVDNWGHFGGLVGGSLAAWVVGPALVAKRSGGIKGLRGHSVLVDEPPLKRWQNMTKEVFSS